MSAAERTRGSLAGLDYIAERGRQGEAGDGWTLLLLHATGGDETQLLGLGRQLLPGAALLAPRGPVSEGGALRFFARTGLNTFRQEDVEQGVDQLADFTRAAQDELDVDPSRLLIVGYSNGANAGLAMLQRHAGLAAGGVLLRAMPVLDPAPPGTPLEGVSLLLAHGEGDQLVPDDVQQRLRDMASEAGASVEEHREPGVGHGLGSGDARVAADWLARHAG